MSTTAIGSELNRDSLTSWQRACRAEGVDVAVRISITEEIIEYLKDLIRTQRLTDGDELPGEEQLAVQMVVGRGTIRESFQVLMHMDLIERKGRKTTIAPFAFEKLQKWEAFDRLARHRNVMEMIELKKVIEPEAAGLAAERASDRDKAELAEALRLMKDPEGDAYNVVTHDTSFHLLIMRATGNLHLLELMNNTQVLLKQSLLEVAEQRPLIIPQSIAFHDKILAAIQAGDAELAKRSMREHMEHVETIIKRFMESTATR